MLDGVDNNETWLQTVVLFPSVDALDEFKLQTSTYSAEFGRSLGGVVNLQIKSGTNQMHGSGFEFLRNERVRRQQLLQQPRRPSEAGFQPASVRRHLRRADRQGQDLLLLRLSGLPRQPGRRPTCRRCRRRRCAPATSPSSTGHLRPAHAPPFPGNVIPQNRWDPAARNILNQLIPEANTAGTLERDRPDDQQLPDQPDARAAGQPDRSSRSTTALTVEQPLLRAATATRRRTACCRRRCRTATPASPSAPATATSRRRAWRSTTPTRSARTG